MRRMITITAILLVFCLCAVAQKGKVTTEKMLEKSPGIIVIEQLSKQYVPVKFKHQLHAQPMTVMQIECSTCHHYSPPDSFPPCMKCHSKTRDEISAKFPLNRPSLEGAYHQRCISCHREWNPEIECSACHVKKVTGESDKSQIAGTEDVDWEHPVMEAEDKKVYNTKYTGGPIVTFLHKEHAELFEIDCADCHREGNCSFCHPLGVEKREEGTKSELEIHQACVSCHSLEDNCQQCHASTTNQGFDHGKRTSWPLDEYHSELTCRQCHLEKGKFGKLETECNACHSDK